jgi:chromosomal replication initiation ATPase DnaA
LEIELERKKGYFDDFDDDEFDYDEDEGDYEAKTKKYNDLMLTPQTKPVVVFANNQFTKSHFEQKYKRKIDDKLNECGKQWCDIVKVVKLEERFERE